MKHRIVLELTPAMVDQLRFIIDGLPLCTYAPLILAVLPKLPLENEYVPQAPPPITTPVVEVGRFGLVPFTDKGREKLPALERLLSQLPHTGDGL